MTATTKHNGTCAYLYIDFDVHGLGQLAVGEVKLLDQTDIIM